MEDIQGAEHHALSGCTTLPASPYGLQPGSSLNPVLLGFSGGLIT